MLHRCVAAKRLRVTVALVQVALLVLPSPVIAAREKQWKGQVVPAEHEALFDRLPNDTVRDDFMRANPELRQRYANVKLMQLDNPSGFQRLQDRVDQMARKLGIQYQVKADPEYMIETGKGHGQGNTRWTGSAPEVRVNPIICTDPELLETVLVHENVHHGQMTERGGPHRDARERAQWEVAAHQAELDAMRRLGWFTAGPDGERIPRADRKDRVEDAAAWLSIYEIEAAQGRGQQADSPISRPAAEEPRPTDAGRPSDADNTIDISSALEQSSAADTAPPPVPADRPVGAVDPSLEKQIETLLDQNPPEKLQADLAAGNFDIFAHPLFKPTGGNAEQLARAWKKVCSKWKYSWHSERLAQLRFELITRLWESIAIERNVRIELIDSGKRNAYRSDLDVTVYSPRSDRGALPMSGLISDFKRRFAVLTGSQPAAYDIVVHDGDVFMPDIRNNGQSVQEYASTLRETVRKLRLKVASGEDAYVFPGANLEEVQKRGLRDGRLTRLEPTMIHGRTIDGMPLETRPGIKRTVHLVGELDPNSGAWRTNSARFEGILPAYDRRNAFGAAAQNFDQMLQHSNDHAAASKYFNRFINQGLGAGNVNSYWDLHVSNLYTGSIDVEEMRIERGDVELAFDLQKYEQSRSVNRAEIFAYEERVLPPNVPETPPPNVAADAEALGEWNEMRRQNRALLEQITRQENAKLRQWQQSETAKVKRSKKIRKVLWIIQAFNLTPRTSTYRVQELYDALNISADIELHKIKGEFDWNSKNPNRGKSAYMQRYFDEAAQTVEHMKGLRQSAGGDLFAETRAARPELAKADDSTVHGTLLYEEAWKRHIYTLKSVMGAGVVAEAIKALKDLTPRGMRTNSFRFSIDPATGRLMAWNNADAAFKLAEQRRVELALAFDLINKIDDERVRGQLRQQLIDAAPPDIKRDVERLAKIADTQLDYFLRMYDGTGKTREELLEEKKRRVGSAVQEAGLTLKDLPTITGDELKEHIKRYVRSKIVGAERWLADIDAELRSYTPGANPIAFGEPGGAKKFAYEVVGQFFSPLMFASAAVNLANAFETGDRVLITEAVVGEVFNFLPFQYGVIAQAFKDFGRGKFTEGAKSVGLLVILRYVPGVGQVLLAYGITTGGYGLAVTRMDKDLIEQAFRSRPDRRLDHAARNRHGDSGNDPTRMDTPKFPLLFGYTDCPTTGDRRVDMQTPHDWTTVDDAVPEAWEVFKPIIHQQLLAKKLTRGTTQWTEEENKLLQKYAWDLPYYRRMSNIYECFSDRIESLMSRMPDSDDRRTFVFSKVVSDWFDAQPSDYRAQFDSVLDIFRDADNTARAQLLRTLTRQLVAEYDKQMYLKSARDSEREMQDAVKKANADWALEERKTLAAKKELGEQIEQVEKRRLTGLLPGTSSPAYAQVWLDTPTWYVPLKPQAASTVMPQGGARTAPVTPISSDTLGLDDDAPIDVFVRATRYDHPQPWKSSVKLAIDGLGAGGAAAVFKAGAPPGFVPNEEEQTALAEKHANGSAANAVYTVRLTATAQAFDARDKLMATSRPKPIVGYFIAPVPQYEGKITLVVRCPASDAQSSASVSVPYEATIGNTTVRGGGPATSREDAPKFSGLAAGSHTVRVKSLWPSCSHGSETFTLTDPFSVAAYRSGEPVKNPDRVEVTLTRKVIARFGIQPSNVTINIGKTATFKAFVTYSDEPSRVIDVSASATWAPAPVFSGGQPGTFTVEASFDGVSGAARVTVEGDAATRRLERFGIVPAKVQVKVGDTTAFKAMAVYADAPSVVKDVSAEAGWSPTNSFTAKQPGIFTISAAYFGATATATVAVEEPVAAGGAPSILSGSTTKTDAGDVQRGGQGPTLNAPPASQPPRAGSTPPAGGTGGRPAAGGGTGSGGRPTPGGPGSGGDRSGGGSAGENCLECIRKRCQNVCADAITLLCVPSGSTECVQCVEQNCGSAPRVAPQGSPRSALPGETLGDWSVTWQSGGATLGRLNMSYANQNAMMTLRSTPAAIEPAETQKRYGAYAMSGRDWFRWQVSKR